MWHNQKIQEEMSSGKGNEYWKENNTLTTGKVNTNFEYEFVDQNLELS